MIERASKSQLTGLLKSFPAVALLGPRQCGKTTLAKSLRGRYFDLEGDKDRTRLDALWETLVTGPDLIILDEAQEWPDIFRRLRGTIDDNRERNGRFLLLGSVSPALMTQVSESLAGRLALLELTPLLLSELPSIEEKKLWLYGGYPKGGILGADVFPIWQMSYLALLSQRDLPQWGMPATPQTTARFLRMLAALHGQVWNASQIGQSMSLDHKTATKYLDFLVGTFLIRKLLPYQANIRKRLVKSPKVYWRDTGLLHALLNVKSTDMLLSQPWVGASWEGFVIEQILGTITTTGKYAEPYYLRTSDQHEIDLVLDFGTELWAIEIKLTSAPTLQDMEKLTQSAQLIGAKRRFLVSNIPVSAAGGDRVVCNLSTFLNILKAT